MNSAVPPILAETKSGDPNQVDTDSGSLPSKEDGEKNYGMAGAEPYSAWRGWVFAELRHMEGGEPKSGYEARLLVVEEKGKLRIAYIELGFIS
ncbi:hypothetical protein HY251_15795 [bacterium]|nr:hypothetical protein [bacterium]